MSGPTRGAVEGVLVRGLASELEARGWRVQVEPEVGLYRPDMLGWTPGGRLFAIEVKAETGTIHFATLSNVAALRSGLAAFGDLEAQPVLIAVGRVTASLEKLAKHLKLLLLVEPSRPQQQLVTSFARHLSAAADAPLSW